MRHRVRGRTRWLSKLIRENNYTLGVELGVKEGMNLTFLAHANPSLIIHGVDMWSLGKNGYVTWQNEKDLSKFPDSESLKSVKSLIESNGLEERVFLHRSFTENACGSFEDESLDFIFIDADHSYEGVKKDITLWSPKVKTGGYIVGHDIDWEGVKRAVEELIPEYKVPGIDNLWYMKKTRKV